MSNVTPIALLLLTCLIAACGAASPTPVPATVEPGPATVAPEPATVEPGPTAVPGGPSAVAAAGVLVTYETRGGECPQGPCGIRAVIQRDGKVERSDGLAQGVDDRTLGRLAAAIDGADWEAILAVPFTGECPVNFDGQEEIYTFTVDGEAMTIASCTTQVDPSAEPFSTVREILFGTGG